MSSTGPAARPAWCATTSTTGPSRSKTLIAQEKPAAIVVMMGSNDRQQMRVGDNREPPMSAAWMKEYDGPQRAAGQGHCRDQGAVRLGRHAGLQVAQDERRHAGLQRHLPERHRGGRPRVRRCLGRLRRRERCLRHQRPRHQRPAGAPAHRRRHQRHPRRQAQARLLRREAAGQAFGHHRPTVPRWPCRQACRRQRRER